MLLGIGGLAAPADDTAAESGEHQIVVIDNFGEGAYRLTVTAAD